MASAGTDPTWRAGRCRACVTGDSAPRDIGWNNQGGNAPRWARRRSHCVRGVGGEVVGGCTDPNPLRDVAGERHDVGLQGCIEALRDRWRARRRCSRSVYGLAGRCAGWRCRSRSPGPMWRRVAAGRPIIRPYPSAAPVTTPSKRASTARISGTASRAATKCISEVPGLAKQHVNL